MSDKEKLAQWMIRSGYATGHGDSVEDLLKELEWQIAEREREACAKVCDDIRNDWKTHGDEMKTYASEYLANAIRARGQA